MNETKYYFLDRAAYLRGLAEEALTPQLRRSCLKAAADYDELAEKAEKQGAGSHNVPGGFGPRH